VTSKHALLSASSSERWLKCPGSVAACKGYTNVSSPSAEEGTLAHEMAEFHLLNDTNPEDNGEMGEYVQTYLDFVRSLPGDKFVERLVSFDDYAPDAYGTADFISLDIPNKTIYIVDFKYGKGHRVSAEDNTQMRLYALGALAEFSYFEFEKVAMIICQPRLDHLDEWTVPVMELYKWGEYVKQRAELALSEDAPRIPGDSQCLWCLHKPVCPELLKLTEATLMAEFDDLSPVTRLTDGQLRYVLDNAKLITSWLSAVEELVKTRLDNSEGFEGYKLVEGRSSREWSNAEQAAIVLSEAYGEDELFERSFISPAKAEKLVGKKNYGTISSLIVKKAGKPALVPASDPRPPLGISADSFD